MGKRKQEEEKILLTRNDQRLAPHNEDNLQGPKLLQTKPATLEQRPAKLRNEDGAEEADADGHDDVSGVGQPVPVPKVLGVRDRAGVDDREREAETDGQQAHDGREDDDGRALHARQRRTHSPDLQSERDLDADDQQQDQHGGGDGDAVLLAGHAREVAGEDGVWVVEGAGEVEALQDGADEVEDEAERVEDEDGRAALVGLRQQEEHDQEHEGGADLGGIVDADADSVCGVLLDVGEGDDEGGSVREEEGDGLDEDVDAVDVDVWRYCCWRT